MNDNTPQTKSFIRKYSIPALTLAFMAGAVLTFTSGRNSNAATTLSAQNGTSTPVSAAKVDVKETTQAVTPVIDAQTKADQNAKSQAEAVKKLGWQAAIHAARGFF